MFQASRQITRKPLVQQTVSLGTIIPAKKFNIHLLDPKADKI